jgi:hypothetical protein
LEKGREKMAKGSDWHINTQKIIMEEHQQKGYSVSSEKRIGFEEKVTIKTQFKQVDIVAEKRNEVILIELEDLEKKERELGVGYVELGGILSLSCLFSELGQNKNKNITLLLVFKNNTIPFRKDNIKRIIENIQKKCKELTIEIQYRDEKGCKI